MGFNDFRMRDTKKDVSERMEQNQRIMEGRQISDSGQAPVSNRWLFSIIGGAVAAVVLIVALMIIFTR